MGITVNGTIIPENVANALSINGVNITNVICNSVSVWNQSLINIANGWSGNSYCASPNTYGMKTSGMLFAATTANLTSGPWITTNPDGTFTGNSKSTYSSWYVEIVTSGSLFTAGTGWITYNPSTEIFTGSFTPKSVVAGETSNGLFRMRRASPSTDVGNWVSLT